MVSIVDVCINQNLPDEAGQGEDVQNVEHDEEINWELNKDIVYKIFDNLLFLDVFIVFQDVVADFRHSKPWHFYIGYSFVTIFHQQVIELSLENEGAEIDVGMVDFDVTGYTLVNIIVFHFR